MLRSRTLVSVYVFLVSSAIAFAQSPTTSPTPVCVTVAFNTAVFQTAEAQHILKDLQAKFAPRQTHLQQLNAEVESLKKQINDSGTSLTDSEKSAKMHTLDTEERQLQREADDFKADTDSASQQAFQTVAQKLYTFLQDYAKQRAYTIVIDRGSDAAPVVWYAAPNADITADLIKAYDLKAAATPADGSAHTNPHLPSAPTPH
jgi:Skp family chaperone for outer membrane proteins